MGRKAVDSNQLFIDGLKVPVEDRIGEEGRGFEYILHGMNPERILIAGRGGRPGPGGAGAGRQVRQGAHRLRPPDRPEPGASSTRWRSRWMELEAAWLMAMRGAWQYDQELPCGADANAAKYLAAEAGFNACQRAMATHGGFGYAKEYHVERYLREMLIPRIAPISPQLILCFIAEKVLGLPKSY